MADEQKRALAIGGSEIAAIFGVHDYLDEFSLWARKKGELPPQEENPRIRLGTFLQQGIAAYYSHLTGNQTEWRDKTERHPEYKFMAYSPDAVVIGQRRGVDVKYVSFDQSPYWGKTVEDIPPRAVMQAWWYMAALDYLQWDIAALVIGADDLRIYTVERDLDVERIMLRRAHDWWKRYLVGDERPPISGSELAHRWLQKKHPRHNRSDVRAADFDQAAMLDEYAGVRDEEDCVKERRALLEAQIKEQIGDHEGLKWPRGKFTWKLSKDSQITDWEGLAQLLLASQAEQEKLLKEFTSTKPGTRRIRYTDRRGRDRES
jgi:predicted phage-related endonuclease